MSDLQHENRSIKIAAGIAVALLVVTLGISVALDKKRGISLDPGPRTRTIMMYGIGSNLESAHGNLSFNISQMLDADISSDVKIVIMTGGSYRWFLPEDRTVDSSGNPTQGDPDVKQIWEIQKGSNGENKLVLMKNMDPLNDSYMTDEICLQTFLTYCKDNYASDLYDLILWDHGYGPFGYGNDFNYPLNDSEYDEVPMPLEQIADAIKNTGFKDKLELIDFDACLMSNVEVLSALSDQADYLVVSAESVPEFGQYYTNWISKVSKNTRMNGYEIGKMIVDDTIAFYSEEGSKGYERPATFAVIDTCEYDDKMLTPVLNYTEMLASDAFTGDKSNTYYNKLLTAIASHKYSWDGLYDLLDMAGNLSSYEESYKDAVNDLSSVLEDSSVIYFAHTPNVTGSCGISIFFPSEDAKNTKRYVEAMESLKAYLEKNGGEGSAPKIAILDNQIRIATGYGLVQNTGRAVSEFVDNGKKDISYDALSEIWNTKEKLSVAKIESAREHGNIPDESGLSTPWDKGISVLMDRAASYVDGKNAEEWVVALASNIEGEIREGTNCALPSQGLSCDITIKSERRYTDADTMEEKYEPYDAVIGNLYGKDESEVKPYDGCWYALTDASGHNYLTSLITTATAPSSGTITVIVKKIETAYDGSSYEIDVQGAITVSLEEGGPRITGIYIVEAGEYQPVSAEEAATMTFYTGYLTRAYGSNRLSPDSVLTLDTTKENFGLSVIPGMRLADMDDVDAARAATARASYRITNIYGYVKELG